MAESHTLQALHSGVPNTNIEQLPPDETVPDNAAQDLRPSRAYQVMLLVAGFAMIFNVIGINQIYGLFQEYYTSPGSNVVDAKGQDALVALVGTIGSGLTWSGSIFVNPLIARTGNMKLITLSGAFVMSLGLFLASFSTRLWHLYLTQALLYGIGASLYYFPIMTVTPVHFDRHRGFAMGLVLSAAGIGGLVYSPVVHFLLNSVGIQWTLKILGLWNFAIAIPVSMVVRQTPGSSSRSGGGTRVNVAVFKRDNTGGIGQSLGALLQAGGNVIPIYYLTTYSVSVLSYSSGTGSLLLSLNNAVNSVARIAMGILADKAGRQNTMILSVIFSGVTVFALWYDASRARFLAFTVIYGIWAGGYNALLPTTIAEVYGVQNYASVNSFIYFIRGLGAIFGAPVAGVILGNHQRGASHNSGTIPLSVGKLQEKYNEVVIYDGLLLLASGACIAYVRWLDARDKGRWSWRA